MFNKDEDTYIPNAPLSPYSATFQDMLRVVEEQKKIMPLSEEEEKNFVTNKGINYERYKDAEREYNNLVEAKQPTFRGEEYGLLGDVSRLGGRFVGEFTGGAKTLYAMSMAAVNPKLTLEEAQNTLNQVQDTIGSYLPDDIREYLSFQFDPAHPDTFGGIAEDIGGTLGAVILGGNKFKALGGGTLAAAEASAYTANTVAKVKRVLDANKVTRGSAKLGKFMAGGAANAAAFTLIEKPEDNAAAEIAELGGEGIDWLYRTYFDKDPKLREAAKNLRINPKDSIAEQYLQSFLNNAGLAAAFTPIGLALGFGAKGAIKGSAYGVGKGVTMTGRAVQETARRIPLPPSMSALISSTMGTSDTFIDHLVKHRNLPRNTLSRLNARALDLKDQVKSTVKDKQLRQKTEEAINNYWKATDKNKSLADIPKNLRPMVEAMDKEFRDIEKMLGMTSGQLRGTISANGNSYMTTAYEAFDFGKYTKDLLGKYNNFLQVFKSEGINSPKMSAADPDDMFKNVVTAIASMRGKGVDDAVNVLSSTLAKAKGSESEMLEMFKAILTQNSRILPGTKVGMKKTNLPKEFKQLLGEIESPYRNYVNTMYNLSMAQAEKDFLDEAVEIMVREGKATSNASDAFLMGFDDITEIGASRMGHIFGRGRVTAGQVQNPTQQIYVHPTYKTALDEGFNAINPSSPFMKGLLGLKGLMQIGATAFSTATIGAGITGNAIMMLMSGHMPVGLKSGARAGQVGLVNILGVNNVAQMNKLFKGKSRKELADMMAEYDEMGLIGSGLGINYMRRALQKLDKTDISIEEMMNPKNALKTAKKLGFDSVIDFYQFTDDFFKINHYHKTLDDLMQTRTYGNMDLKDLKRLAGMRTRDTMPNYFMLPKILRAPSSSAFIGEFGAFPASFVRNLKNNVRYMMDDLEQGIRNGDPYLLAMSSRRLAGMTTVAMTPSIAQNASRDIMGITKEQEEALENSVIDEYDRGLPRVYLSPIQEYDTVEGPKYGAEYWSFARVMPDSYVRRPVMMVHDMLTNNRFNQERLNQEIFNTVRDVVSPFIAPSMLTDAGINIYEEAKRRAKDPIESQAEGIMDAIIDKANPFAMINYLKRKKEYDNQIERYGEQYRPTKKGGKMFALDEYSWPAFWGFKTNMADISNSIRWTVPSLIKENKNALSDYYKAAKNKSLIGKEGERELGNQFIRGQQKARSVQQRFAGYFEDMESIFGPEEGESVIAEVMSDYGLKNVSDDFYGLSRAARDNIFLAVNPSPTKDIRRMEFPTNTIEETIRNMYFSWDGTPLFPEVE